MIVLSLSRLSVLERAAKAYSEGNLGEIELNAQRLYPDGRYPFVVSPEFPFPLHLFSPRLTAMLTKDEDHLDAMAMWRRITARENILRMITATELERTAAESLGKQFEVIYKKDTDDVKMKRKQMIGYMIKVVMECFGYLVYSSRMLVNTRRGDEHDAKRKSNYFTTATRYALMSKKDRNALLNLVDEENKAAFLSITDSILKRNTEYQSKFKIDDLNYWDSL
jgi:hypothetical protein